MYKRTRPYRINVAMRSLGLPPLLVDRDDPGTERMSRGRAWAIVACYAIAYGPAALLAFWWAAQGAHK
jgi:hypothetical protein